MLHASAARTLCKLRAESAQFEPVIDAMLRAHSTLGHAWPAEWRAPANTPAELIAAVREAYERNGWRVDALQGIGNLDEPVLIGLKFTLDGGI